ncbi:unnamed protein product, partial [Effrenium voratum]
MQCYGCRHILVRPRLPKCCLFHGPVERRSPKFLRHFRAERVGAMVGIALPCGHELRRRGARQILRPAHPAVVHGIVQFGCTRQSSGTLWRRPNWASSEDESDAKHEMAVRIDALRRLQEMQLPSLPPSANLQVLGAAVSKHSRGQEMEGHCAPEQLEFLRSFVAQHFGSSPQAVGGLKICQIGFNAGHSAVALLDQAPEGSVLLSLDLCQHEYTQPLERVVAALAEERGQTHVLLQGDSAEMLPRFQHIEFDLMFIDGNHAYEAVKLDMLLCLQMATPESVVLLNHVFTDMTEGVGPTKVWLETLREGEAEQLGWHSCCSRHGIAIASRKKRDE